MDRIVVPVLSETLKSYIWYGYLRVLCRVNFTEKLELYVTPASPTEAPSAFRQVHALVRRPSPLPTPGYGTPILSIAFGPIVGDTEHLAVLGRAFAALAPRGNVVGVHFGELPYLALVGSMADCAERTIGCRSWLRQLWSAWRRRTSWSLRRTPVHPAASNLEGRRECIRRCRDGS